MFNVLKNFNKLKLESAALTFHTVFAIVPVLSLMVAIANGLGYSDIFKRHLYFFLRGQETIADQLLTYVNSYLDSAQTNLWFGICVGLVVLLYTIFSIFQTIDKTFNSLWKSQPRSFKRLIKIYSLILVTPILVILFTSLWWSISSYFKGTVFHKINILLFTFFVYVLTLFVIYTLIPTTKVNKKYAGISATVCGILFAIMQLISYQIIALFDNYKTIYGDLASTIIFLLWIYYSWTLCLSGSKLNYYLQESKEKEFKDNFNKISFSYYKFLAVLIIERIESIYPESTNFRQQELVKNVHRIYGIPIYISNIIIQNFIDKNILHLTKNKKLHLDPNYSSLSIKEFIYKLEYVGINANSIASLPQIHENKKLDSIWTAINKDSEESGELNKFIRNINAFN